MSVYAPSDSAAWKKLAGRGGIIIGAPTIPSRLDLDGLQGSYKPSELTAGTIPGIQLEEWGFTDQTITGTGSESLTIENKIIRCDIDWRSTGQLNIINCFQPGWNKNWTSASAWIRTDSNPGNRNVFVRDSIIRPAFPSGFANAFLGPDFTAIRNIIEDVTDGFGVRRPSNWASDNRVRIWANIVRRLSYYTPDPAQSRPNTHNDCIQLFAGYGTDIVGNVLLGTVSDTAGTEPFGQGTGSGKNLVYPAGARPITVSPTVNVAVDANIDRNWMDYGSEGDIAFNIGNDSTGLTGQNSKITGNRHGRNQVQSTKDGVTAKRALKIANAVSIPGFTGGDNSVTVDTQGNVYEDDGSPIMDYRGVF